MFTTNFAFLLTDGMLKKVKGPHRALFSFTKLEPFSKLTVRINLPLFHGPPKSLTLTLII